jgi:hypothetical protein
MVLREEHPGQQKYWAYVALRMLKHSTTMYRGSYGFYSCTKLYLLVYVCGR